MKYNALLEFNQVYNDCDELYIHFFKFIIP